ncbi:MAG: hypothetical protein JSS86_26195, partial [Cyanobacteria bacterium SZAS LIN-2]|nr:hypothetical protein [Cyanobacteria bacterium SZAS LIN-2]
MQEKKNTKKQLGRLWLVMPAFVWLSLFVVIPLVILFVYSFGERDDLGRVVLKLSLSNYLRFISGPYLITLARSILLSTITTLSALVLGYLFALWLAVVAPKKKRNFLLLLIVLPLWTSSLLRVYAWITLLR